MARNGTFSNLSARQQAAILALLDAPSIATAAKQAHVGRRTLFRWLSERPFAEAYTAAKAEAFGQAMAVARAHCGKAVQFLVNLLDTVEAPMGARVAAARAVIDFARADAIEAVEARVAELEAIMDHYEGDRHHAP